jgi:hypothetical protein
LQVGAAHAAAADGRDIHAIAGSDVSRSAEHVARDDSEDRGRGGGMTHELTT